MQYFFGALIFDDPMSPKTGWASTEGGTAFRFDSITSLSTDTIWLCNVKYQEFYITSDLGINPWMRSDGYLPIKIDDILSEWGNDPDQTDRDEMAMFVAAIFSRIMQITMRLLKKNNPKLSDEQVFTGRQLKDDLRPLLPPAEFPSDEAGSILRSGVGYMDFTKITARTPKGSKMVVLRIPRLDHAIEMLTTPIPVGPFELHQTRSLPTLKDLVCSRRPVLANIVIKGYADPVASRIYAFGQLTSSGNRIPRTWVQQPELAALSAIATVDVQNAFIGKSYIDIASEIVVFIRQFLESGDSAISWSCGIVAEAIWKSACLGDVKRDAFLAKNEQPQTSWRGAWVSAADKVVTFMAAMKMTRAGYHVSAYSSGTIYCYVPPERRADVLIDAWKNGLTPKMRDVTTPINKDKLASIPWGGQARSKIPAQIIMLKKQDVRWELDRIPLCGNEERIKILKEATTQMR